MMNLVLGSLKDYTLIARVTESGTVHEYVVAWCYDKTSDSWAQGHYFDHVRTAISYMENKKMTKEEKRAKIVGEMHNYIVTEIDDEEAYYSVWTCEVPDEPTMEDFDTIAQDKDLWTTTSKLFGSIIENYDE